MGLGSSDSFTLTDQIVGISEKAEIELGIGRESTRKEGHRGHRGRSRTQRQKGKTHSLFEEQQVIEMKWTRWQIKAKFFKEQSL